MPDSTLHALERIRVADCMHHGIYSCEPDASLADVASIMSSKRVHAIAVSEAGRPIGIVSDADLVAAVARADEPTLCKLTAREIAGADAPTASGDWSLRQAAQMMAEHGLAHVVVLNHSNGHPIGVLSASDIASVLASSAPTDA